MNSRWPSASWLDAVESFFAKLTKKRLKRGVFRSLQELKDAIYGLLDDTNANPSLTWTTDPNKIIGAVKRAASVTNDVSRAIMVASRGGLTSQRVGLMQLLLKS
jgi:hypothetical protein